MPYKFKKGGTVVETGAKQIPLPLSKQNLKHLLQNIMEESSEYTHQDFANWCSRHFGNIIANNLELKAVGIDEATYEVLNDVDAQWDLFLVNTYTIEELQTMDLSKVKLPDEWYKEWLSQLS
jgi:hypothetical protein